MIPTYSFIKYAQVLTSRKKLKLRSVWMVISSIVTGWIGDISIHPVGEDQENSKCDTPSNF